MFKFQLGQGISIIVSEESGEIIGRAEYSHMQPNYFVRFKDSTGRAREEWWTEDALKGPNKTENMIGVDGHLKMVTFK